MWIELLLFAFLVLLYYIVQDRKPRNMPPGPWEIPFLGNSPILDEMGAMPLKEKYGDIVTVRTGYLRSVVLFDYKLSKEVMARPEMAGRPGFFQEFSLDDQKLGGLVGSNGIQWQHDRRFVLRNLRNLGMGKSYLEEAIHTEAQALVDDLKNFGQKPIIFPDSFRTAPLNIIWQMVASKRYDHRSSEVDSIYKLTKEFQSQSVFALLPFFFPSLQRLPRPIKKLIFGVDFFEKFLELVKEVVLKHVDEHQAQEKEGNNEDLIYEYLKGMENQKDDDNDTLFRKGALLQIVSDLFQAGSDTVNNMIKWTAFLLARYPDIAQRLQKEMDDVVPRDRLVSLDDKPQLPLMEAFMTEALRFSSMIIMNVQRSAMKDTTIGNYFVPKDTIVVVCNYAVHHDPRFWKNPDIFNPDRFISEDGKFVNPKEGFFAFGSGRRQCLGETLARMEFFLFSAALVQNFTIKEANPSPRPILEDIDHKLGLRVPKDVELIYEPRT